LKLRPARHQGARASVARRTRTQDADKAAHRMRLAGGLLRGLGFLRELGALNRLFGLRFRRCDQRLRTSGSEQLDSRHRLHSGRGISDHSGLLSAGRADRSSHRLEHDHQLRAARNHPLGVPGVLHPWNFKITNRKVFRPIDPRSRKFNPEALRRGFTSLFEAAHSI
jgi:hypothetical protein